MEQTICDQCRKPICDQCRKPIPPWDRMGYTLDQPPRPPFKVTTSGNDTSFDLCSWTCLVVWSEEKWKG